VAAPLPPIRVILLIATLESVKYYAEVVVMFILIAIDHAILDDAFTYYIYKIL